MLWANQYFKSLKKIYFSNQNEIHTCEDGEMNKHYYTVNDFPIKCNSSEILAFFFIGHVIMGVAR